MSKYIFNTVSEELSVRGIAITDRIEGISDSSVRLFHKHVLSGDVEKAQKVLARNITKGKRSLFLASKMHSAVPATVVKCLSNKDKYMPMLEWLLDEGANIEKELFLKSKDVYINEGDAFGIVFNHESKLLKKSARTNAFYPDSMDAKVVKEAKEANKESKEVVLPIQQLLIKYAVKNQSSETPDKTEWITTSWSKNV